MKVAKDTFLIHVQGDRNSNVGLTGGNGKKIQIDTDYNKYKHTVQVGEIYACPIGITQQYSYDTPLNVGDHVVFHHFVCQPDHKMNIGENIYRAEYFHLYAKIENNNVMPLEDAIFVEPILEDEDNLFAGKIRIKTFQENIKQKGVVFASSKKAQAMGILAGDIVHFTVSADYQMNVVEKDLYRMRIRNIISVERNGTLICLANKILMKQIPQEKRIGGFFDVHRNSELLGIVSSMGGNVVGVKIGEAVSYFNSALGSIEFNGDLYSMIEMKNINYILR